MNLSIWIKNSWSKGRFRLYIPILDSEMRLTFIVFSEFENNHMRTGSDCERITNVFENI